MDKTAKTIIGVLAVVILLIFFRIFHLGIIGAVVAAITVITTIALLYLCIRLNLKFNNPYFKLTAVAYGLQLATPLVWSLAGIGGYLPLLSLGGSVPLSTSSSWFTAIRIFLVMYAALLYREGWEDDAGAAIPGRFSALVPAADTSNFWLVLAGAPLVYNAARELVYFHIMGVFDNVPFAGHPPVPTGIMDVLTQTVILRIMLLTVILNISLFKVYRTRFFKYMYIISLVNVIYTIVWGIISLYTDWLFVPPHPGQSHALDFMFGHSGNYLNLIPAVFQSAIPLFTALVFFNYEESRTGGNPPA
jgi:hypothetical protein